MKRERNKREKRASILEAAHVEFEGQRFDAVKLDDIAVRAGVGKGTLYLYFKNKEDLFLNLAVDGMDQMAERVREMTESDQPYENLFCELGGELVDFFQHRVGLVRLMHQTGSKHVVEEFKKYRERMQKALSGFLKKGVAEGVLRGDASVDDQQVVLVGSLLLQGRLLEDGKSVSSDALLKIIWDGIVKREN